MSKKQNLVGRRFNRLIVLEEGEKTSIGKNVTWRCLCDCGKETLVLSSSLLSGKTESCGCLKIERLREAQKLPVGEAAKNIYYKQVVRRAKENNLELDLSKEDILILSQYNCAYCGSGPSSTIGLKNKKLNGTFTYNGLDRVDNTKGYTKGNVVPCCYKCNRMKGTLSKTEFLTHIQTILKTSS